MLRMYYLPTKCSYCGQQATNQPVDNGCHTCQRGIMREE